MNDTGPIPAATSTQLAGRNVLLRLFEQEGVRHLFGNPGTTELPLMDALVDHPQMSYVLALQESVVVAMADGYARASGRLAVANVHVAPGLGNAVGALYNAKIFGSPLIVTAGQHEQGHGLTEPMLYDPLLPIAEPMVKWAVEVTRVEDLPRVVHRAAKVALTPPTGPVFISLPGDVLDAEADVDLGRPTRIDAAVRPTDDALGRIADALLAAANPLIIAGHEVSTDDAFAATAALAELIGAGVRQQTVPYAAHFPSEHPCFLGALTRNQTQVRDALAPHDLFVFIGTDQLRMSVPHAVDPLPPGRRMIQIGERDWEIAKNYPVDIAVKAAVRATLDALNPFVRTRRTPAQAERAQARVAAMADINWTAARARLCTSVEAQSAVRPIDPRVLMMRIADNIPRDAVVVEEGLTSTFSLLSFLRLRARHDYFGLASGGIGFAIAGAVGISLAQPDRPVVAIIGDGSAMYSIQALWTAAHLRRPIIYVIANNRGYRILKERQVARRGNRDFRGYDLREPDIDFVALAQSMGVRAQAIASADEVGPALRAAIAAGGPHLLDVRVADGFGG